MSPEILAFVGEFEVVEAAWSLANGRTATFRICGEAFGRNHPFKKFQQKRGGRVGTRFRASFARTDTGEEMGSIELMLMAWKDSSSIGQTVAFWLDNDAALHPFAGCAYRKGSEPGEVFAVAIVELTDDDKPVRQTEYVRGAAEAGAIPADEGRAAVAAASESTAVGVSGGAAGPAGGPGHRGGGARGPAKVRGVPGKPSRLSSLAHRTVTGPMFVQFLKETKPHTVAKWTPEIAKSYAKTLIKVESLSDLDRDAAAAERFRQLIGRPFDTWRYQFPM